MKAITLNTVFTKGVLKLRLIEGTVLAGYVAETDYYFDGEVFSTDFDDALLITRTIGDWAGAVAYEFEVPSEFEDLAIAVTPTMLLFGDTPVEGAFGEEASLPHFNGTTWSDDGGGSTTVITANPVSLSLIANDVVRFDCKVRVGETAPIQVKFLDDGSGSPPNYTGRNMQLKVLDHNGVSMFNRTGVVSTTTATGDTVTFTTTAANTTTDLDAQISPVRAAAGDRTSLPCEIWNMDANRSLTEGIMSVRGG